MPMTNYLSISHIRKVTKEDAFVILNEWLKKCNQLRKLDFNPSAKIKENL